MTARLKVEIESFALAAPFRISRGSRTEAEVVVATVIDGALRGHGECTPYTRYGETIDGVAAAIEDQAEAIAGGLDREGLQRAVDAGAARNALDCALWDLEAKRQSAAKGEPGSVRAWNVSGLPPPSPVKTVFTIGLAAPGAMRDAAEAAVAKGRDLLKVKLGAKDGDDDARIRAVREAAPDATLVVDANEGFAADELERYCATLRDVGVALLEQPLPAGEDEALDEARAKGWAGRDAGLPLGADESAHTRKDLTKLRGRYDVVNIKLDKAGGLTEALSMATAARTLKFDVMVGCMMATSLSMAPAFLVAQRATFVDLDGPLWMKQDRANGMRYDGQSVHPPEPALWG